MHAWRIVAVDTIPVRVVKLRELYSSDGIKTHWIGETEVRIYSAPKSIADALRNPKLVDRLVALEALKAALDQGRAIPASLMQAAADYIMCPHLGIEILNKIGPSISIVRRPNAAESFVVAPKRWVVARTFACLRRCQRPANDRDALATSEASMQIASIRITSQKCTRHTCQL